MPRSPRSTPRDDWRRTLLTSSSISPGSTVSSGCGVGQWAEAERRLNAVAVRAAAAGDRFQEARALNDLGMGSVVRARWDEALPRFERVLSFQELESLSIYAAALSNAGICYSRLGDFDRALAMQRRSVTLHTGQGHAAWTSRNRWPASATRSS